MNPRWAATARTLLWVGLLGIVAATPLIVSTRLDDGFRLPKLLFFQASTLAMAAVFAVVVAYDDHIAQRFARHRFALLISLSAVLWTAIATLFSRNPVVSHNAPFTMFCYALFFVMVVAAARRPAGLALTAAFVPVVVTSLYAIAQVFHLPTPFVTFQNIETTARVIGLLGNPNYVATFLLLPTLAAIAAMFAWPRYAPVFLGVAALGTAAIVASQTMTALVALAGSMIAIFFTIRSWRGRAGLLALVATVVLGIVVSFPIRERMASMREDFEIGEYSRFTSFRLPAFAAAGMLFRERPWTGAGPGMFAAEYLTYRLRVDDAHPEWFVPANENFGEVHNDHLQILAEAGLPGYLILLAFLARIAWMSFRPVAEDEPRARFVRIFALPGAAAFAILALAQFPMQLAAAAVMALFLAGLCFAWEPAAS